MRRPALLLVVPASLVLVGATAPSTRAASPKPATVCARATQAVAKLTPPSALADAQAGVKQLQSSTPPAAKVDPKGSRNPDHLSAFTKNVIAYDETLQLLSNALGDGDGPAADSAITRAQSALTGIDQTRAKAKVPAACSSKAFGADYFASLAPVITAALAPTGNFTVDANAACSRLGGKIRDAQSSLDITDPTSVETYVDGLDKAFKAFSADLQAFTPPPELASQFTALRTTIGQAVQKLDQASRSIGSATRSQLQKLGSDISALGDQVTSETAALGLTC